MSLVGIGFDSKCDFCPSYCLAGASPLPLDVVYLFFFGGIQHSPVNGCSAASCNFGVLTGKDEHTSFYSIMLDNKESLVRELNLTCRD